MGKLCYLEKCWAPGVPIFYFFIPQNIVYFCARHFCVVMNDSTRNYTRKVNLNPAEKVNFVTAALELNEYSD